MARRSSRSFTEADKAELLKSIGECRNACVAAITRAPISGEVYRRTSKLMEAIDDVAEELTGKREHFHVQPSTRGLHFGPDEAD
jgi:hypothetical protein